MRVFQSMPAKGCTERIAPVAAKASCTIKALEIMNISDLAWDTINFFLLTIISPLPLLPQAGFLHRKASDVFSMRNQVVQYLRREFFYLSSSIFSFLAISSIISFETTSSYTICLFMRIASSSRPISLSCYLFVSIKTFTLCIRPYLFLSFLNSSSFLDFVVVS